MPTERRCEKCGAALATFGAEALCPNCMLREAIRLEVNLTAQPAAASLDKGGTVVVTPVTEKPGDRIGRYKLLQPIGEGGMGVVYMAEQEEPVRRRVALKVIKLGMDTKSVIARFEAERQALALMDHPNIAKVLDAGATDTGRPYFVMELVRGIRITDYCDQNHCSTQQRLDLFTQICKAIQHAHQKGIIHRDIKPSNILVTLHDGVPVPKIIDFGIAKATNDQRLTDKTLFTAFQQFIGTPAYMSPEQAEMSGLDIDTRSDIYSLGVLLYELLTGRTPFDAKELLAAGLDAMRRTIREKEPLKPSTRLSTMGMADTVDVTNRFKMSPTKLAALVRGDLDWIVMKCLEKDRTRRYETANGLAMDLQRHLSNEPVVACPPSALYRFQKLVRRNKLAVAATGAVGLALILGTIVSALQAVRATRAEAVARAAQSTAEQERQRTEVEKTKAQHLLYAVNMNLAQQAWEQNNFGRLTQLLEETQTSPDRGFEWYYWQRQTHLALKTLYGHLGYVNAAAFFPDGRRILTGSLDLTTRVWSLVDGQEQLKLNGHSAAIYSVAVSPDGNRIATGSGDETAKVWDVASGREVLTLRGHHAGVRSVAFSPDGRKIVTGAGDHTAKIWNAVTGMELLTLAGHQNRVTSVAFSGDGQRIVTGSEDNTAKIWNVATGNEMITLRGHGGWVESVAFSPDGQRVVSGSQDSTAKVWEVASGTAVLTLRSHGATVRSVGFSPDGQCIVTGSEDDTAKIWTAVDGRVLSTFIGHSDWIRSVSFSPDSKRIISASDDKTAKVWETTRSHEPLTLYGHNGPIWSVAISPDGQRIATGSGDRTARVWDSATYRQLLTLGGPGEATKSVAFSSDGKWIVTGGQGQATKVWDAASGANLLTFDTLTADVNCVAMTPDRQRVITGGGDGVTRVLAMASGEAIFALKGHSGAVTSVAASSDGKWIVTGSTDQTSKVWDLAGGGILHTLTGHRAPVLSVAISPDGSRIVTCSEDQTARVWDAASGKELFRLDIDAADVRCLTFSSDGRRILSGSGIPRSAVIGTEDWTAKVWDSATGKKLLSLKGHQAAILSVALSRDGRRIVTGSWDHTAKVWEAASEEQVASWRSEERLATENLASQQRERDASLARERALRVQDPGAIRQWLLLFPLNGTGSVDEEQIPQEAHLRVVAGERVKVAGIERVWRAVQLEDYLLDFNQLLGIQTEWSVAYALCYIQSQSDQTGLLMKVGSDDQAKVYLNGTEIYRCMEWRPYFQDQAVVPGVKLKAGLNVLVFKVMNETGGWKGSIRFTDHEGKPVPGLKVILEPN